MTRTLVLLRHGRTAWNDEGRAQGHADVAIDEVGGTEARAAAAVLARLGASRIWSSDLVRARETAEIVATTTGLVLETDKRLREYDVGARQGLTMPEFAASFPDEHAAWAAHRDHPRVDGAETVTDVVDRIVPALRDCLCALADGQTGIVVGHGASLRTGLCDLLGWPAAQARTLRGLDNCGWAVVSQQADGALRLAAYNRTAT